jgi:hypothetical protein
MKLILFVLRDDVPLFLYITAWNLLQVPQVLEIELLHCEERV